MTKAIPAIAKYMTTSPKFVQKDENLYEAAKLMQRENFRHLPVLYNGKIEGILSSTDIQLISGIKGIDIAKMKVYDAFSPNPYTVSPETHLDQVCREMANKKFGCVLIEDQDNLVGIFTWIDALRAMDDLLHTRLQ